MKTFKTLDEQIQLLHNRNLIINDEDYAKKYLLSNNYYNIINGYSKMEYSALYNKIRKLTNVHLEKHLKSITPNEIMYKLGFPKDWHLAPKLI